MKAVIPVAGAGTHLRPHTHTQPKPLLPVAGKPILGHIIENLLEAGIKQQVFVVGHLKEKIQEYVERDFADKIDMEFFVQEPRRGLGHAIWTAKEGLQDTEEILVVLGDTIFDADTKKILNIPGNVLAVQEVDDPRSFGIVRLDEHQQVIALKEKPAIPTSNLALVGLYKISSCQALLAELDKMIQTGQDGQQDFLLTDALMGMIHQGINFRSHSVENWFDCGKKDSLLQANRIMLERLPVKTDFDFENSVIIPPVYISQGCKIKHSIIGPHVAIAENAQINHSIVKDSILGAYSELDTIVLTSSVVGNDTTLRGHTHSVNIGDDTEIDFNPH